MDKTIICSEVHEGKKLSIIIDNICYFTDYKVDDQLFTKIVMVNGLEFVVKEKFIHINSLINKTNYK